MVNIIGDTADDLYKEACAILSNAPVVTARGLKTREIMGASLRLRNPFKRLVTNKARSLDYHYMVGELCYFLDCRTDLESIAYYSKFWNKVSDDGETVNSAYGYRLFGEMNSHETPQLDYVVSTLWNDKETRKAVMPIYSKDDARDSNDNPCTMFLQFLIRNNKLECYTFMRSNDIWLGLPYDIAFFTLVHEIVYVYMLKLYRDLELGHYNHIATSLHAYERDFDGVKKCVSGECTYDMMPKLTEIDVGHWFDHLLPLEKLTRGVKLVKPSGPETAFQTWCASKLINRK